MSTPTDDPDARAAAPAASRDDGLIDQWRESAARSAGHAYEAAYGREIHDASTSMRWRLEPRVAGVVCIGLVLLGTLVWWLIRADAPEALAVADASAAPSRLEAIKPAPAVATPSAIVVHVSGAVVAPGLVDVSADARVADAVDAAGGVLADADLAGVNLARAAADGEHIHVPSVGEREAADGPVNINIADAVELQRLPGVGEVMAERIVADRDAHGPFASIEDAQRVSGVGPAMVAGWDGLAQV